MDHLTHCVHVYIEAFKEFVVHALEAGDVVFVFDRYFEANTKAYLRTLREMKEATCRVHVLSEGYLEHPLDPIVSHCDWVENSA